MKYRNLAGSTQRIYSSAVAALVAFLTTDGVTTPPAEVTRRDVEAFVRARLDVVRPATVSADFRALQQFFKWMVREEEIARNPMEGAEAPLVPEQPMPVLEVSQLKDLLATCKSGNDLVSRRDNALLRLLIDTGGRLSEISDLRVEDVDFDSGVCHVIGKGRRGRALPFGQATALAGRVNLTWPQDDGSKWPRMRSSLVWERSRMKARPCCGGGRIAVSRLIAASPQPLRRTLVGGR